jgi:LPS-assembly lipoprotein
MKGATKRAHFFGVAFLALFLLGVVGCGFHLRGNIVIPSAAKKMYLQSNTPYGRFEAQLKRSLKASGAIWVGEPQEADIILEILDRKTDKTVFSVGSDARAQAFQVSETIQIQLLQKEKIILPPTAFSKSAQMTFNKSDILGKTEEEMLLLSDIRRELVYQAMQVIARNLGEKFGPTHP